MQQPPSGGTWVDTTGRVSRCLKPTVWIVEQSVSGVLYISSLLRSLKLPKRKGISDHANTGRIRRTLVPMSAGTGAVFSGAIKSPTVMDFV
ncbi:hypothetical protein V1477_020186 [Vespula maculifrons]|uniref:Uncharacterized protein n=1 Tax=Vespula maculifrons TaxID=7453 RepID=A0ABD2AL76_VESMC